MMQAMARYRTYPKQSFPRRSFHRPHRRLERLWTSRRPSRQIIDAWIAQSARTGDGPPPEYKDEIMQVYQDAPP